MRAALNRNLSSSLSLIMRTKSYLFEISLTSKFRPLRLTNLSSNWYLSTSEPPLVQDQLNEDLYWDKLKTSLNLDDLVTKNRHSKMTTPERRVFVLQLKMQYKSKPRQSTTAELQLAESISLVETLQNWRVVDYHIIGMKRSYSAKLFGEGNQVRNLNFID